MKALKKGGVALVLAAATALAAAEPLLVEGKAACFKKGYQPDEVQVAIDRATGALYLKSPCGWQFFRVLLIEEIAAAVEISKAIEVPQPVLAATVSKLNQIRIAYQQRQVRGS